MLSPSSRRPLSPSRNQPGCRGPWRPVTAVGHWPLEELMAKKRGTRKDIDNPACGSSPPRPVRGNLHATVIGVKLEPRGSVAMARHRNNLISCLLRVLPRLSWQGAQARIACPRIPPNKCRKVFPPISNSADLVTMEDMHRLELRF